MSSSLVALPSSAPPVPSGPRRWTSCANRAASWEVLSSNNKVDLLIEQAREFQPNAVVIGDTGTIALARRAGGSADQRSSLSCRCARAGRANGRDRHGVDRARRLRRTEADVERDPCRQHIALANKETLVVAGELVTGAGEREGGEHLSCRLHEHSAIFQCLAGEWHNPIEKDHPHRFRGPFRWTHSCRTGTCDQSAGPQHPNWDMGAKITIDSASPEQRTGSDPKRSGCST